MNIEIINKKNEYEVTRLNEQVYEFIKKQIIEHTLKPNEKIDIKELSAKIGVSTTPIMNSLRELANEGLVEIRPQVGTFVSKLSKQDYEELFMARLMFESFGSSQAAKYAAGEQISYLENIINKSKEIFRNKEFDNNKFIPLELEFHDNIVKVGGGERIYILYMQLHCHIQMSKIQYSNIYERAIKGHNDHVKIFEAIIKHDSDAAYKLSYEHVMDAKNFFINRLDSNDEFSINNLKEE
jgi:DNA-binding GntR family transcriptional regulator